jgi:hypothetical protein
MCHADDTCHPSWKSSECDCRQDASIEYPVHRIRGDVYENTLDFFQRVTNPKVLYIRWDNVLGKHVAMPWEERYTAYQNTLMDVKRRGSRVGECHVCFETTHLVSIHADKRCDKNICSRCFSVCSFRSRAILGTLPQCPFCNTSYTETESRTDPFVDGCVRATDVAWEIGCRKADTQQWLYDVDKSKQPTEGMDSVV